MSDKMDFLSSVKKVTGIYYSGGIPTHDFAVLVQCLHTNQTTEMDMGLRCNVHYNVRSQCNVPQGRVKLFFLSMICSFAFLTVPIFSKQFQMTTMASEEVSHTKIVCTLVSMDFSVSEYFLEFPCKALPYPHSYNHSLQ